MSRALPRPLLVAALLVCVVSLPGCTTLRRIFDFKEQVEEARAMVRIGGAIETEGPSEGTLVAVLGRIGDDGELKGADDYPREHPGTFLFITDAGRYQVGAYEDRNRNGILDPGERVSRLRGSEVFDLGPGERAQTRIRLTNADRHTGEPIDILGLIEKDVKEQGRFALGAFSVKGLVVEDMSDDRFGAEQGPFGLWQPVDFLNNEWAGIYLLEEYDPNRIPVLYVHGIAGYPRQFEPLIESLDRERFQPWFYFYPSGFGLDGISTHLSDMLRDLHIRYDFDDIAVVAHSMGGLVSRGAILKYFEQNQRRDVKIFVSINTPWGGDVTAERTANAPIELPQSFKDMNPNSAYIGWVFYEDPARELFKQLPPEVEYHMIFGYGGSGEPYNDTSVSVESQAHADLQEHADSIRAWNYTHVGTLSQPRTIERVNKLLGERF